MIEVAGDSRPLSHLLRTHREAAGLTQRQLAESAGVGIGVVRALEQGLTSHPRHASLQRLSAVLDMPLPGPRQRPLDGQSFAATGHASRGSTSAAIAGEAESRPTLERQLEISVLGPVAASLGGEPVPLGSTRQRAVLGLLAISPLMQASRETLIESLWGEDPPPTAVQMIHSYISRLRRALGGEGGHTLLTSTPNGYRIVAERCSLDLVEFTRLADRSRAALQHDDAEAACHSYERALSLWTAEPLADIDVLRLHPRVVALARLRAATILEFGEAAVTYGWPDRVLQHLQDLMDREPLNERACGCLMVALAEDGQQAAALTAYEAIRHRLDAELGVLPGPELSRAHYQVLTQRLPVARSETSQASADADRQPWPDPADTPPGCQLPPAVTDFTGREEEAELLAGMIIPGHRNTGVPMAVISGLPGVGKTSLAIAVAHQVRDSFPDGQLWISLNGSSSHPRDPAETLGDLLLMLGVHGSELPVSVEGRAALYRSRLAGQRVLVIADDAASSSQVEPLLPGTSGSAVIITSRSAMVVPPGARLLPLNPLAPHEAAELLGRIAGQERITAEQEATAELAAMCGMLPLAVRIAGARLAARPTWPISVLAYKLSGEVRRLDELQVGSMSVRASLASSYEALEGHHQRALCLLGMLGPVEVAEWVIAALLDQRDAADVVAELTDRSLLTPVGVDLTGQPRYRLHDLIREFAVEKLSDERSSWHDKARERALRGWLQLASRAASRLPREPYFPREDHGPSRGPIPNVVADVLTSDAVAWLRAERLNLLVVAELACRAGDYRLADQLARVLAGFHYLHSQCDDAQRIWTAVLSAADNAGDQATSLHARLRLVAVACGCGRHAHILPEVHKCVRRLGQADDLGGLATALYWQAVCDINLGAFTDACDHAHRAVEIARQTRDRHGEFMALRILGMAQARHPGLVEVGIANCERALDLAEEASDPTCHREVLHTVAYVYSGAQRHTAAMKLCQRGLDLDARLGYPAGEAIWLGVLGDTYFSLKRYLEASVTLRRALETFRQNFMRRHQALCLLKLGYAHQAMGDYVSAVHHLTESLPIFAELRLRHYERRAQEALALCQKGQFSDLSEPPGFRLPESQAAVRGRPQAPSPSCEGRTRSRGG